MYKCIVLGITLEKLNGPGYGTIVHIFILGSCNILSFANNSLSMWEELWWQSAWWIVSNFQVQMGITLEKLKEPGYTTNVHIFILGSRNIHKHLIKHVGGVVMTKHMVNCLTFWAQKSITGVNLNGLGYPTNVHIFMLGSCNVQSFMNFWLIM
jgi:hypothetical protein